MNNKIKGWIDADDAFASADDVACRAAIKAIRSMGTVSWMHGEHVRSGRVMELHEYGYMRQRVKVEADSGKQYWVPVSSVLSYEKSQCRVGSPRGTEA